MVHGASPRRVFSSYSALDTVGCSPLILARVNDDLPELSNNVVGQVWSAVRVSAL